MFYVIKLYSLISADPLKTTDAPTTTAAVDTAITESQRATSGDLYPSSNIEPLL